MKALVTGANGFIGSHLCELLVGSGYDVRAFVRRTSDLTWLAGLDLEFVYGDLRDPGSLAAAAAGAEVVFHAGATVRAKDIGDYERVNREGTRLVAEACVVRNVKRLVLFSSASAAGPAPSVESPCVEDQEPRPVTHYGRGKLGAEQVVVALKDRLQSVILRFPAVYGPRDRDILMLLRCVQRGLMPVLGDAFSAVHVRDAARSALLAAEKDVASGSVYYVADGSSYRFADMATLFEKLMGRKPLLIKLPAWLVRTAGWFSESLSREGSVFNADKARELTQQCWVCAPDKARAELGFEAEYDLERGMRETIAWYRENGWL
jgi:nucleoside-diphosphate-sugar epimerase